MLRKIIVLFLSSINLSIFCASGVTFDEQQFKNYADKYGNKTANLRELQKVVGNINQDDHIKTKFAVPPFFGVSHQEVVNYLRSVVVDDSKFGDDYFYDDSESDDDDLYDDSESDNDESDDDDWLDQKDSLESKSIFGEIQEKWQEFVNAQEATNKTSIVPDAQKALADIRALVHKAFAQQFKIDDNRRSELHAFLERAKQNKNLLMVRSTGREDSKTLSNAGGNESVSSVKPDFIAISNAMGEVIASYFGEKSIGQRLSFNDPDIFETPFMPVLLQQMIGEPAGGAKVASTSAAATSTTPMYMGNGSGVPASGVAFFPEAEGRTPGVATIQATWGHNEAVVNGLVPVDSFYVGSSDVVHPVIRIKKSRLVTSDDSSALVLKANPVTLHKVPSLPKQRVLDIRHAIQAIRDYYGYPVDIEFVYLDNTIYLVQARPLEEQRMNPTYVDPAWLAQVMVEAGTSNQSIIASESDKKSAGTAIGVGGADVRIIEQDSQVIIKDTINMALDEFLKRDNKDRVKAIIVGQMAPSTSHEATIFRAHNKPVLKTDIAVVGEWVNKGLLPLVIDPQQEIIFVALNVQDVEDNILKGWYNHPIPKKVSVLPQYIKKLDANIAKILAPAELMNGMSTTEVLNVIRQGKKDEVIKALKALLARVAQAITRQSFKQGALQKEGKQTEPRLIAQLKQIYMHLATAAGELYQIMQRNDHSRLERLYPFVFIKALIQQIPDPRELVNNVSFISILKTELMEQKIGQNLQLAEQSQPAYITQYAKAGDYALTKEVENDWFSYIASFDKEATKKQKEKFSHMMYTLAQLNVLPMWLNVSFAQGYKKNGGNPGKVTQALFDEYEQSIEFITKLEKIRQSINSINMENWEKPEMFEKQMKYFKHNVLDYFSASNTSYRGYITAHSFERILADGIYKDTPLLKSFHESGIVGKVVAISVMRRLVEVFDASIKTLKGSLLYKDNNKLVKNFVYTVRVYLDLLNTWGSFRIGKNDMLLSNYMMDGFYGINMYFYHLGGWEISQLYPSINFNVAAATIGSGTLSSRSHSGKYTAEDLFSVVHQDLLMVIGILTDDLLSGLKLPDRLNLLNKHLIDSDINRIGLDFTSDFIKIYYNRALRNHSYTVLVNYNRYTDELQASIKFMGLNLDDRWNFIEKIALVVAPSLGLEFLQLPKQTGRLGAADLSFTVKFNNRESFGGFCDLLSVLSEATMFQRFIGGATYQSILREIAELAIRNKLSQGATFDLIYKIMIRTKALNTTDVIETLREVGIPDDAIADVFLDKRKNDTSELKLLILNTNVSEGKIKLLINKAMTNPYLFIPLIIKGYSTIDNFLKIFNSKESISPRWQKVFYRLVWRAYEKGQGANILRGFLNKADKFDSNTKTEVINEFLKRGSLSEKIAILRDLSLKDIKRLVHKKSFNVGQVIPALNQISAEIENEKLIEFINRFVLEIKKFRGDKNRVPLAKIISSWGLPLVQKKEIDEFLKLHNTPSSSSAVSSSSIAK